MAVIRCSDLVEWVGGSGVGLPEVFDGITQDTRQLVAGNLYVALRGERFDGHNFVGAAFEAGAAVALVERGWQVPCGGEGWPLIVVDDTREALLRAASEWRRRSRAQIVGVTGSCGKTTTKEMVATLLRGGGKVWATEGNLNNDIGLPLSILRMDANCDFGVFEAGTNHPGEIGVLADVMGPQVGVVSSIGAAHIEYFGSVEAIAHEKGALLRSLPEDGVAVLSRECALIDELCEGVVARQVWVSLEDEGADFVGRLVDAQEGVLEVRERASGAVTRLCYHLPGRHNAQNMLLAFGVGRVLGVDARVLAEGAERLEMPELRWQRSEIRGVTIINDSYNASAESMEAAVEVFMGMPVEGARIVVAGDMGELGGHSEELHRRVGRVVAEFMPDLLITVGEEAGRFLAEAAIEGGMRDMQVISCDCVSEAVQVLRGWAGEGDAVLLKGSRFMRLERIVDEFKI